MYTLSRKRTKNPKILQWDGEHLGDWATVLENSDVLINLTGKSVDCRYTETNKTLIMESRTLSTSVLGEAVLQCKNPPKVWLNASTSTIYSHSLDTPNTEESETPAHTFSEQVAKAWEESFFSSKTPKTRKVAMRISIVLGRDGGALTPLKNITKFGLGGTQGAGNQMISWVHEDDLRRAIDFCITNDTISGPINIVAPNPVRNAYFMKTLRKTMRMPIGLPAMRWMLAIGTFLLGTEAELVLKSRFVHPGVLREKGFTFHYPKLEDALKDLI